MNKADRLFTLHVDEAGQVRLPEELQKLLVPGTVLTVASRANGAISLRIEVQSRLTEAQPEGVKSLCRLIDEDSVLVITGPMPENFDWEAFMLEDRELQDRQLGIIAE